MGGSLVQAEIVYNYFGECAAIHPSILSEEIVGTVTMTETQARAGHTFSCVTASPKQVRGKHPDTLISDETCETSDELMESALPMVNDSPNPMVVMASTFHKIFGIFAETWDNAEERGYLRIQWDIFDVMQSFPANAWEEGLLRDGTPIRNIGGIEKLKAMSTGRCGDPEGWIPLENVIQAWREKPSESWFEVEYMGSRPSTEGLVLKPEDVDRAVYDSSVETKYKYVTGATVVIGIDWGFSSMTAVTEVMGWKDQVCVLLDNVNYTQTESEIIIKDVVQKVKDHGIRFIYADSAGKFENAALQSALARENLPCKVVEVVFSKEKEGMLGNLRAHFERSKMKLPKKFRDAYYQLKNYRYQEGTDKPVKKDDHVPDSLMCALQHFILGVHSRPLPMTESAVSEKDSRPVTAGLRNKVF